MSSYLNIYLIDKKSKEKKLLFSTSRSDELYQEFSDVLNVAYAGNEDRFTDISMEDFDRIRTDIEESKNVMEKRLAEYEKYANGNAELIEEILNTKKFIEEQTELLHRVDSLKHILQDCLSDCNDFSGMAANVD